MSIHENNIIDIADSTLAENTPMVIINQDGQTLAIPMQDRACFSTTALNANWLDINEAGLKENTPVIAMKKNGKTYVIPVMSKYEEVSFGLFAWNDQTSPSKVSEKKWNTVKAGGATGYVSHYLALDADYYLYAWGRNNHGQLGLGDTENRTTPTKVGDKTWRIVSAGGDFSYAIDADGKLYFWGKDHTTTAESYESVPTHIRTEDTWTGVSAGLNHTLAFKQNGELWSWGNNDYGQTGVYGDSSKDWYAFSAGTNSSFVLANENSMTLYAWGRNNHGQLGLGDTEDRTTITKVAENTKFRSITSKYNSTFAIDADGYLYAWGLNNNGQLGLGDTENRTTPTRVGDKTWKDISTGGGYTIAIDSYGKLFHWGGDNAKILLPTQIGNKNWHDISVGYCGNANGIRIW